MHRDDMRRDPARGRKLLLVALAVLLITGFCVWLITLEMRLHEQEPEMVAASVNTDPAPPPLRLKTAAKKVPPPKTPAPIPTANTVFRKLAIIGAGPSGLTTAFRAAPVWGAGVVVIDPRPQVGGKVQSYCLNISLHEDQDLSVTPTCTSVHGEQWRSGDVIMRCMASKLGIVSVKRGAVGQHFISYAQGYNTTGNQCFGLNAPTEPATCDAGFTSDGVAPNGHLGLDLYEDIVNPCGDKDWTECSYQAEYDLLFMKEQNVKSITPGESFPQYAARIVGTGGVQLYRDTSFYAIYLMRDDLSAQWGVDYLRFDFGYAYGHIVMPHGGPHFTFRRMAFEIAATGAQIRLNERVVSVASTIGAQAAAFPFKITTNLGNTIYAERLVSGIQPKLFAEIGGDIAAQVATTQFVEHNTYQHACTMNFFFPTKFWEPFSIDNINVGFVTTVTKNWTLPLNVSLPLSASNRSYVGFLFFEATPPDPENEVEFLQFVPIPERIEGNLLRLFMETGETCDFLEAMSGGNTTIMKDELMRRIRLRLSQFTIPDPVEWKWSNEPLAYSYQSPGTTFTAKQLAAWAANPLASTTKRMCIAGEAIIPYHSTWMEGGAASAHNCFRYSPVFSDVFSSNDVTGWEQCDAVFVKKFGPKILKKDVFSSTNDVCLLLPGEYHVRDFYRKFCGGPSVYDYPTEAELFNNTYMSSSSWSGVTNLPVYDTAAPKGHRGIKG